MPLVSTMTSLRDVLVAALKSLLRGKSFIKALLAFWTTSSAATAPPVAPQNGGSTTKLSLNRAADDFLAEAEKMLVGYIDAGGLMRFSRKLKRQFRERLRSNPACMLPSYSSRLPTGREAGQYLALDVGGSTLRVALVELRGLGAAESDNGIVRMDTFRIDNDVRNLRGTQFFDWMAERIHQIVEKEATRSYSPEHPLLLGLAWSFPIEQTSSRGGKLSAMGKGFLANEGLIGEDLGELIKAACQKRGLHVELSAIVNDSSAALLSEAYITPSTRFSLILGTGVNIAVHLPVTTIDHAKFGDRPSSWHEKASHVIVNTELGMFGHDILPLTRWDKLLKAAHPQPELQPLEQLVSGYYLGEICRLALVEAIPSTGIFGGVVPPSLQTPYSLDTETLSLIEGDTTPSLQTALQTFTSRHPFPAYAPTPADMSFLRALASHIARRSASVVAASLFALWELKAEAERDLLAALSPASPFADETAAELRLSSEGRTAVAFNGSVVEQYPGYRACLQAYIDGLLSESANAAAAVAAAAGAGTGQVGAPNGSVKEGSRRQGSISLVPARESSLRGAAVALALS